MLAAHRHEMFELLLIAKHLWPGGFKDPMLTGRVIQQGHQIMQQVFQRDGRGT